MLLNADINCVPAKGIGAFVMWRFGCIPLAYFLVQPVGANSPFQSLLCERGIPLGYWGIPAGLLSSDSGETSLQSKYTDLHCWL